MVFDASLLNIMHYKGRVNGIKGKWSNPRKEVALSPTSRCSCYWNGSLRVALDYGRLTYIYREREIEKDTLVKMA